MTESANEKLGPAAREYAERTRPKLQKALRFFGWLIVGAAIAWLAGWLSIWWLFVLGLIRLALPMVAGMGAVEHIKRDVANDDQDPNEVT